MIRSFQNFSPALRRGNFAEVYLEDSRVLSLRREDGRLQDAGRGGSSGAGLRWMDEGKMFFSALDLSRPFEGLSEGEKKKLAFFLKGAAGGIPVRRGKFNLPVPARATHAVKISPAAVSLSEKIKILETAEKAARLHKSVRQVRLSYGEKIKRVGYLNSRGESFEEERTYVTFTVSVTAERNGVLQSGYESIGGLQGFEIFDKHDPVEAARLAARRAMAKLNAPPAPLGEMAVVISSSAGGTLIHEAIGHALEADAILEGSSPHFAGKSGKVVANAKVTVLDDPTRPGNRGSFAFDDEGIPSEKTILVENGVLKTYLYDRRSAVKVGRKSNGHGRRESYAHNPIPRMSNTFIAPWKDDPEEILRSLKKGLFVTRMGGGQVNTATGDFVFEVEEGFRVENGRVKNLVRGANILGNAAEVLKSIDKVGWDLGWSIGTCGKEGQGVPVSDGVPTLRIPRLVVGGADSPSENG